MKKYKCKECKKLFIEDKKGDGGGKRSFVRSVKKNGKETVGHEENECNECIKKNYGNRGYRIMHSKSPIY